MADLPHNKPPVPSSSSSSSSSSPTLATKVPVGHGGSTSGGGGGSGGSGESSSTKKRCHIHGGNSSGGGASTSGGEGKRKKGELIDVPKSEPICSLCGKRFGSWKGVFGHLRAHPERNWRGAFPPPVGAAAGWSPPLRIGNGGNQQFLQRQRQLLAPTLLNFAQQTFVRMSNNIDLNIAPQEPHAGPSAPAPPPPPRQGGGGRGGFDLNLPPPPEKEEENDENKQEKREDP